MTVGIRHWLARLLDRPTWLAGIAASAGAGLIHLAHGPAHLVELGALGAGFYVAAALQLGWAAVALAAVVGFRSGGSSRRAIALAGSGIAINGAIFAAWLTSRVVGLPAGEVPWAPEAIRAPDGITAIFEGLLLLGLIAAFRTWTTPSLPRLHGVATVGAAIAILLIATATAFAITPSEAGHAHPSGYEHGAVDEHVEPGHHGEGDLPVGTSGS